MAAINAVVPLGTIHPLRYARMSRGLTQVELEKKAGLPASTLSHYESGRRQPDPATLYRIALALELDPEVLIGN